MLAQDREEIYVTFPRFTNTYGKDRRGFKNAEKDLRDTDFLQMHEYGPFRLDSKEHMTTIARFLYAYTCHVAMHTESKQGL